MHPADRSGDDRLVRRFDVAEGALRYPAGPRPTELCCTAGALRAALAVLDPTEDTVVFVPVDQPDAAAPAPTPAAIGVTALPVTDAVKRVAGGRVVATVDRSALRWLVGPARVERAALQALLAGLDDAATVHPLTAGALRRFGPT